MLKTVFIDTLPFRQCYPQSSINIKFSDWERSSLISQTTNSIFKFENRTDLIVENPQFLGYNCPRYMKASLHFLASTSTPSKMFLELQRKKCNQRGLDQSTKQNKPRLVTTDHTWHLASEKIMHLPFIQPSVPARCQTTFTPICKKKISINQPRGSCLFSVDAFVLT